MRDNFRYKAVETEYVIRRRISWVLGKLCEREVSTTKNNPCTEGAREGPDSNVPETVVNRFTRM